MDDCEILNDVDDATHIVLGKENRRTIKVLLGIASGRHCKPFISKLFKRKVDFNESLDDIINEKR